MHLRTVLILLLVTSVLAMLVLLPRSPMVLGWLWQNAQQIAAEQGYSLEADSLHGNAWGGVSVSGLELSGPGTELTFENTRVEYGLLSLLSGSLTLSAEVSGVRGNLNPGTVPLGGVDGDAGLLPINLQQLSVSDLNITVAEYYLYLPSLSINELEIGTDSENVQLEGSLTTGDGTVAFDGTFDLLSSVLQLDVNNADVTVARHWWPHTTAGTLTGQLGWSPEAGFWLDAFITDAAIDYLEVTVHDISGPVTIRDLIVESQLAGTALDGPIGADITVDIPSLNYQGILSGNPRLEQAVPWLGRNLAVDLSGIPAEGPMALQAVVTGWYDTLVSGTAGGSGTLAGMELASLLGDFAYQSHLGTSVDAHARLGGGEVYVRLAPDTVTGTALAVTLSGLQPFEDAPELLVSGQGNLNFAPETGDPQPSNATVTLSGELLDANTSVTLDANSADTTLWSIGVTGQTLAQEALSGQLSMDLTAGSLTGDLNLNQLELPLLPWPLEGTVSLQELPLELPLDAQLEAGFSAGPLQLIAQEYRLQLTDSFSLNALDGSLEFSTEAAGAELQLNNPGVLIELAGQDLQPLSLQGALLFPDSGPTGQLQAAATVAGQYLALDFTASEGAISASGDASLLGMDWQLSGSLLPEMNVSASSPAGTVTLARGDLTGRGQLRLPEGTELLTDGQWQTGELDWELSGDIQAGGIDLLLGANRARIDWSDGLQVSANLDQQLRILGLELLLRASLTPDGAIDGQLLAGETGLDISGHLDDSQVLLQGDIPAGLLQEALAGTVDLSGQVSWQEGLLVSARAAWHELVADFFWQPGTEPELQASAPGLEADLTAGELQADFQDFAADPYLELPAELPPVSGSVSGPLQELAVALSSSTDWLQADLSGSIGSELDLLIAADVLDGTASLAGSIRGPTEQPTVAGTVTVPELGDPDLIGIDALSLEFLLDESGQLLLSGNGVDLQLSGAELSGQLAVPAWILGERHTLQTAGSSGELLSGAEFSLSGPLLYGTVEVTDVLEVDLRLSGEMIGFYPLTQASLSGSSDFSGNWTARLQATAPGPTEALDQLSLGAQLAGDLQGFSGTANLRTGTEATRLLTIQASSDWSTLELTSDLASLAADDLAALHGLDTDLSPAGEAVLQLSTGSGPTWDITGALAGTVSAVPLDVQLSVDAGQVLMNGSVAGEPARLTFTPGESAALTGSWAGAELQALLSPDLLLSGSVTATADTPLNTPVSLQFELPLADSRPGLIAGEVGPAAVDLSGLLFPETDLSGTILIDGWPEQVPLRIQEQDGLLATASHQGLLLSARLAAAGLELSLTGDMPGLNLSSDLHWSQALGFRGSAGAAGQLSPAEPGPTGVLWRAQLQANPEGSLAASGTLSLAGQPESRSPLVQLDATIGRDPLLPGSVSGTFGSYLNLVELWPAAGSGTQTMSASGRIAGSLLDPSLSGSMMLRGVLQAEGRIDADLDGVHAALNGNNAELAATMTGLDWQLEFSGSDLQAEVLTDLLPGAEAGLDLNGHGSFADGSFELTVESVFIRHEQALLTGRGSFADGWLEAAADLELDLSAVDVGVDLQGLVSGSLAVSGWQPLGTEPGVLSGELLLADVAAAGSSPLNGNLSLAGTAADPHVLVSLDSDALAEDVLQLDWRPVSEAFRLTARLDLGPVQTDLFVAASPSGGTEGAGSIVLPGGSFTLSTMDSGELLFTGLADWSDWGVLLDLQNANLAASGNLAAISPEASGELQLQASLGGSGPEVSGTISGLELLGIEAGNLNIGMLPTANGGLTITGESLEGHLRLNGEWQLTRFAVPVTDDLLIVASGSGDLSSGNLNASLSGGILNRPLTGHVEGTLRPGTVTVNATLELLGGEAELQALLRDGAWQGQVELTDLLYSGIELDGSGLMHGPMLDPRLELTTSASLLGIAGQGTMQLGRDLFGLNQTFSDENIGGDLNLQGTLWPEPRLLLAGADGNVFRLEQANEGSQRPVLERSLVSSGQLRLQSETAEFELLAAQDGASAALSLALPLLPGFEVDGQLQLASLRDLISQLDAGVELQGRGETAGELTLNLFSGRLNLADFGFGLGPGSLLLDGYASLDGTARLAGQFRPEAPWLTALPGMSANGGVPFALISSNGIFRLVSTGRLGDMEINYDLGQNRGTLTGFLHSGGGRADLSLAWSETGGLSGTAVSNSFVLFELPDGPPGVLNADLTFDSGQVEGTAALIAGGGRLNMSGNWALGDLLPAAVAPFQLSGGEVDVRISSLEVSELPPVALYAPAVTGGVTAVVQLRNQIIAGNVIATDLEVAGEPMPIEAVISGSPRSVDVGANLAGSPLTLQIEDYTLSGLLEMRRFPLQRLAEAFAGPLDVLAEVTGVVRFALPVFDLGSSEFRVATEQVHLERAGIVTTGNVSMALAGGEFEVSEASFSGAGTWRAGGVLREDLLDFELVADDADLGPMLGLVPILNQLGVGADGSLRLVAQGDLANPHISLVSDALSFEVAGISYVLEDLLLELRQSQLALEAELLATDPIQGALSLSGGGGLHLAPLAFENARFEFGGSLVLPVLGQLEGISGALYSADASIGAPLLAEVDAVLGNPLAIRGSLAPLDLTLSGRNLLVDLPGLYLVDSRLDADLTLVQDAGLALGGTVTLHESMVTIAAGPDSGAAPGGGGFGTELRFDNLRVIVPARLRLAESFGNVELAGDVTVGGTLAEPFLSGRADALRGSFQFAGRDFALQESAAIFDATRGLYPELRINATTTLDRSRLLPPASDLQIVSPAEGSAVVTLSFTGTVEPDPDSGIRLDLNPVLTSNVLVRPATGAGNAGGPRPLNEDELLALITLGRIDFESFAGEAGLAPVVAQGALETAIDLLIMSELQRALGEALGLDLVEIRSSALTNILSGAPQDQQFGVSVRFGGYVSDEVFATYRLSAFDDPEGIYAFSNEVGIRYALGPVLLDLTGRLGVTDTADLAAVAQLSLGVQYELNPATTIEAAFDVSGQEQLFRFGVTWRW